MAEFKYEITQELGVLSESKSGWTREINLVSWNGAEPKFDIRDWAPEHEKTEKYFRKIFIKVGQKQPPQGSAEAV